MKKLFNAVLFDFDGTIADTGEGIFKSIQSAVAAMGFEPLDESTLRTFIGPPARDSFSRVLGLDDEKSTEAVKKYREAYSESGIFALRLYDGTEELFRTLRTSGVFVGVCSSKPEPFIRRILAHLGFEDIIDVIASPASDTRDESKAMLIERAAATLGVDKDRVLMVGDRHFDIDGANLAGVTSVGVTYGYGSKTELEEAGATHIAKNVAELYKIIFG